VIFEKLVSGDVTSIHTGNGMVHQKARIELRHPRRSCNGSETLAKIIAPL
jgi:hypothetical protein